MIRVALIGCGEHAEAAHADPLRRYADAHSDAIELTACCDPHRGRAETLRRRYGFATAYDDAETMLDAERVDAVVCVTPVEATVPVGSAILRRGIPCVLEKPPGCSLEEMAALRNVARETGTPHMISLNRRFGPFLNRAMAWAKEAGPVCYVHARMLRRDRHDAAFVWGTGVHLVDATRYIGGEWADFEVRTLTPPQVAAPWFFVSLRFASGALGTVEIAPTAGMVEESYELYGDGFRASATTYGGTGEVARFWRGGSREKEEWADPADPISLRDGSYEETYAFLNALRDGTPLHPTIEEVAPTMELCARIQAATEAKV